MQRQSEGSKGAGRLAKAETPVAFILLSFEGPDRYSSAGGLGSRISGLARALAAEGFETHLFFIGSPDLEGHEVLCDGLLHLHRWCQWISHHHPNGVYDGEEQKLWDWTRSIPEWLDTRLLPTLVESGRHVVVLAEEWQTSWSIVNLSRRTEERAWRKHVRFYWNANNTFGFERVPWQDLRETATITTVSRFMKHELWRCGVDPHVVPNGIAPQWLEPCDGAMVKALRRSIDGRLLLAKVARWDPEKRWLTTVEAMCDLKARGLRPLLLARGGLEQHGHEVIDRARSIGLSVTSIACDDESPASLCRAVAGVLATDLVLIGSALSRSQLQLLYRASDGVLANSGIEPFGLVGLEAMASGGVSFVGATGEDYATPGHDAISLQTSSPNELSANIVRLHDHPEVARRLRHAARRTAAKYTWNEVIRTQIVPMLPSSRAAVS